MRLAAICEQEMIEVVGRGWADRDASIFLTLQEERAKMQVRPATSSASSMLHELAADVNCGHNVRSTVFIEARSMYRPDAMGYLKDATGGFSAGLLVVPFFPFLSAVLVLILGHNPALERSVVPEAAD